MSCGEHLRLSIISSRCTEIQTCVGNTQNTKDSKRSPREKKFLLRKMDDATKYDVEGLGNVQQLPHLMSGASSFTSRLEFTPATTQYLKTCLELHRSLLPDKAKLTQCRWINIMRGNLLLGYFVRVLSDCFCNVSGVRQRVSKKKSQSSPHNDTVVVVTVLCSTCGLVAFSVKKLTSVYLARRWLQSHKQNVNPVVETSRWQIQSTAICRSATLGRRPSTTGGPPFSNRRTQENNMHKPQHAERTRMQRVTQPHSFSALRFDGACHRHANSRRTLRAAESVGVVGHGLGLGAEGGKAPHIGAEGAVDTIGGACHLALELDVGVHAVLAAVALHGGCGEASWARQRSARDPSAHVEDCRVRVCLQSAHVHARLQQPLRSHIVFFLALKSVVNLDILLHLLLHTGLDVRCRPHIEGARRAHRAGHNQSCNTGLHFNECERPKVRANGVSTLALSQTPTAPT